MDAVTRHDRRRCGAYHARVGVGIAESGLPIGRDVTGERRLEALDFVAAREDKESRIAGVWEGDV